MRPWTGGRSVRRSLAIRSLLWIGVCAGTASLAAPGQATLVAPDNGSGTVALPPGPYLGSGVIVNGLPADSSIAFTALLVPAGGAESAGGSLGGDMQSWNPATLQLEMTGTGALAGFSHSISITGIPVETASSARTPGTSPQSFETDVSMLLGQASFDPEFDLLRITAGTNYGLSSPGHTTLTTLGGGLWLADSFFDIQYRIDFIGHPGGTLEGRSGSTTATARYTLVPEPTTAVLAALGVAGLAAGRSRRR